MSGAMILLPIGGIFIGIAIGWLWDLPYCLSNADGWFRGYHQQKRKAEALMAWIRRKDNLGRPDRLRL